MNMRLVGTLVIGGFATVAAWIFGNATDSTVGAFAFILAPFLAAVTVGITAALLFDSERSRHRSSKPDHCTACRQSMGQIGALWVCAICDRAPIAA